MVLKWHNKRDVFILL